MSVTYFKPRERFDFAKDTLDIGNPLQWNRSQFLKHFFKRLFAISGDRLDEFYQRHLAYYLANHPDGRYASGFISRSALLPLTGKYSFLIHARLQPHIIE
jgi:hypothetical protein